MKRKAPYIEQMEHSECGLACFAMVLGYFGHHITLPELRETFGSSKKGISLYNLAEMGCFFDLKTKAFKVDDLKALKDIELPAILFWEEKHFVILENVNKASTRFHIIDPSYGRRKLNSEEFNEKFSQVLLSFSPNSDFKERKKKFRLGFFLSHIIKHKKIFTFLLISSLLLQGFGLLMPKITQWVTDSVILDNNTSYINLIGISVIVIYIFYQLFSVLRGYLIARLQTLVDSSLMTSLIKKMFSLPYSFFETRTSGDLVHRANSNFIIREILSSGLISVTIDTLLVIGYVFMMVFMSFKLTVIVLIFSSLLIINVIFSTKIIRKLSDKNLTDQSKTQSYLTEAIYGITDVKTLGIEDKIFKNWRELFERYLKTGQRRNFLTSSLDSIGKSIQFITPLALLWFGINMILNGSLTLGELLAFTSFAGSFLSPIVSLGSTYSQFVTLGSFAQRLQDIMDTRSQKGGNIAINNFKGNINLTNVSYKYDAFSENVLNSINFNVNPGEKIAIVGPSGSGKSSLAKILLGLSLPSTGTISYDSIDIKDINMDLLRNQIGSILQETRLFHGSILENIQAFDDRIPLTKVEEVAKIAAIHEDIVKQPMGYHTIIGEGGTNFSGGQRQRLLLARALITNPKLLVLDEATSALDNITEFKIKENLEELNCTQIIIAHRLSTVIKSDQILVMNNGQIVESGTHSYLISQGGFYNKLYFAEKEQAVV